MLKGVSAAQADVLLASLDTLAAAFRASLQDVCTACLQNLGDASKPCQELCNLLQADMLPLLASGRSYTEVGCCMSNCLVAHENLAIRGSRSRICTRILVTNVNICNLILSVHIWFQMRRAFKCVCNTSKWLHPNPSYLPAWHPIFGPLWTFLSLLYTSPKLAVSPTGCVICGSEAFSVHTAGSPAGAHAYSHAICKGAWSCFLIPWVLCRAFVARPVSGSTGYFVCCELFVVCRSECCYECTRRALVCCLNYFFWSTRVGIQS